MKATLKLIPLTVAPKKGQTVVREWTSNSNNKYTDVRDIFMCYNDGTFLLGRGELVTISDISQIICQYRDGSSACAGEDRGRLREVPLLYDYYDKAVARMIQESNVEVEIKLVDALGMTNDNPNTSCAIIVSEREQVWDSIANKFDSELSSPCKEVFDWLKKNYDSPKEIFK